MFNGKTHYKWPFSIAMLNYQRVNVWDMETYDTVAVAGDRMEKFVWKQQLKASKASKASFFPILNWDTSLTHMVLEVSHHWSIAGPSLGNLCGIVFTHKSEINGYVGTSILLKSALMKLMMNIYPLVNEQSYWKLPFLVDLPPTFLWFSIVFCMFTRGYTII